MVGQLAWWGSVVSSLPPAMAFVGDVDLMSSGVQLIATKNNDGPLDSRLLYFAHSTLPPKPVTTVVFIWGLRS